jgi:predicted nucleotidyltransferase
MKVRPLSHPLPIFRSDTQAAVLAALFIAAPGDGYSLTAVATLTGRPLPSVHREVARLEEAGIVTTKKLGNTRMVRSRRDSPYHGALEELLMRSAGPVPVLRAALDGIAGVADAYIFGSWAARARGEHGEAPGDIDVLVVGAPHPGAIYDACSSAEQQLGRDVNPVIIGLSDWQAPTTAFLRAVKDDHDTGLLVTLRDSVAWTHLGVDELLAGGRLEPVPADLSVARDRLAAARVHLVAAEAIVAVDPDGSLSLAYDAVRKAVTAHMLAVVLRPRNRLARTKRSFTTQTRNWPGPTRPGFCAPWIACDV